MKVTLHGPDSIDGWTLNFAETPLKGDILKIDSRGTFLVVKREWREMFTQLSLHIYVEQQ